MTPDVELSAGAAAGTLSGSAVSQTFRPTAATAFGVTLMFSSDAVGSVALVRTLDQGSTWATRKAGPNDLTTFPVHAGGATKVNVIDYDGGIYRFQTSLSAGSVSYSAATGRLAAIEVGLIGAVPDIINGVGYLSFKDRGSASFPPTATVAQRNSLLASLWIPLASADISGTIVGYKARS